MRPATRAEVVAAVELAGKAMHLHCGQHGGLAKYEQMPFLMIDRGGPIDLAPTILARLDLPAEDMDGQILRLR